jgi:hypothetical protein
MPTETRAGRGVIVDPADVLDFVHILAGRAVRAKRQALNERVSGSPHGGAFALGRAEGYRQAIAEALGVEVAAVDVHEIDDTREGVTK